MSNRLGAAVRLLERGRLAWPRWRCRSCSGSARARAAARPRARSPIRSWAPAFSRSPSRSRAAPRRPPRSARLAWFVLVPLRLRSLPVLLFPFAGAVAVSAWALSKDPFTQGAPAAVGEGGRGGRLRRARPPHARAPDARRRGGGGGLRPARARPRGLRRRIGVAAVAFACVVPLAGVHLGRVQRPRHRRPASASSRARRRCRPSRAADACSRRPRRAASTGARRGRSSRRGRWRASAPAHSRSAAALPQRHLGHAPRARLVRADAGRLRPHRPGPHDAPVPHLVGRRAQRHRAAAAPARARRRRRAHAAAAGLGRRSASRS